MKSRLLLILVLAGLGTTSSYSQATINFGAGYGLPDVRLDINTPLPNGNPVKIGYFDAGFDVMANGSNIPALLGSWNELGGTYIREIFGEPGRFADTLYNTNPDFDDQKIWMWICKTSSDAAPAPDYRDVLGYGLYTSTQPNWVFPAQDSVPMFNTASIDSSEIDLAAFGYYDPNHLFLTAVPEPSAWMLGSAGLTAMLLFAVIRSRERARVVGSK